MLPVIWRYWPGGSFAGTSFGVSIVSPNHFICSAFMVPSLEWACSETVRLENGSSRARASRRGAGMFVISS